VNKNLSDMGRELENIGQVTTVGDLPEKLTEVEEGKVQVEAQLLERVSLFRPKFKLLSADYQKSSHCRMHCCKKPVKSGSNAKGR